MTALAANAFSLGSVEMSAQDFGKACLELLKLYKMLRLEVAAFKIETGIQFQSVEAMVTSYQTLTGRAGALSASLLEADLKLTQLDKKAPKLFARYTQLRDILEWARKKFHSLFVSFCQTVKILEARAIFAEAGVCVFVNFKKSHTVSIRKKSQAVAIIRRYIHGELKPKDLTPKERDCLIGAAAMSRPKV